MTRSKPQISRSIEAVDFALKRELDRRGHEIKPIELVKIAIAAYLSFYYSKESGNEELSHNLDYSYNVELRKGTQSAVDKLLFNANYWCVAYEQRIIDACADFQNACNCLNAVSVWTTHTLKLNTLTPEEVVNTFERFYPPFEFNNRRGSRNSASGGKGPLPDFEKEIERLANEKEPSESIKKLSDILRSMKEEAAIYKELSKQGTLSALYSVLPAWCLQGKIPLVNGAWWDDYDVMSCIINVLYKQFIELGFGEAICQYFLDSCYEALDAYYRDLIVELSQFSERSIPELIALINKSRDLHPCFETDGYGSELPTWLISKEQLIWNILVCAIFGPASARPLLVDSPNLLANQSYIGKTDVITELARTSFIRYTSDRDLSQLDREFSSFSNLPVDLRNSSIAFISSIHSKLETLGYEILPAGSCYPDRRVNTFTESEVECLAILEHRRWLRERMQAGWTYNHVKDVEKRESPYMVPWEDLPERAKEWNRSAVRSIPALLGSVNLAVVK